MTSDLSDSDRVKLIRKALEFCGEPVTPRAISRQFHIETGRWLGGSRISGGNGGKREINSLEEETDASTQEG